jgi:hypothetical protein
MRQPERLEALMVEVGSRMVWLAELEPLCRRLAVDRSPLALDLSAGLRAAAAERVRRGSAKAPTAFRFYPGAEQQGLLSVALAQTRRELWGRAA